MINYKLVDISKPINENDILDLEKNLNISFPDDLREFFLKFNGGRIEGDRNVYLDEDENDYSIKYFTPIKYARFDGDLILEKIYNVYVNEKKLVPSSFIPFCLDGGGWPYCFNVDSGEIYLANIERYDQPDRIMELIASSLEVFINRAVTEEEAY